MAKLKRELETLASEIEWKKRELEQAMLRLSAYEQCCSHRALISIPTTIANQWHQVSQE